MNRLRKLIVILVSSGILIGTSGCTQTGSSGSAQKPDTVSETTEDPATDADDPKTEEAFVTKLLSAESDPFYARQEDGHGTHTLSELREHYSPADPAALDPYIKALSFYNTENSWDPNPEETVRKLYQAMSDRYDQQEEQAVISTLISNEDLTSEEWSTKSAQDYATVDTLLLKGGYAVRQILEGPYAGALDEILSENEKNLILSTPKMTEEAEALNTEFHEIHQQYNAALNTGVKAEKDGKEYTEDEVNALEDGALKDELTEQIGQKKDEIYWPLYHKLIENRNAFARELGYQNYIDYAYKGIYNRDYTASDVESLRKSVYEATSRLEKMASLAKGQADMKAIASDADIEEILDYLEANVSDISPVLETTLAYLRKYQLYSADRGENRMPSSYMALLPADHGGLIFANLRNDLSAYSVITHEFAHFSNYYLAVRHPLSSADSMDVVEIPSQALELMMSEHLMQVNPVEYGDFSSSTICSMIHTIQMAVVYGSFELECFENPDMTAEEMNELFESLLKECVYGPDGEVTMSSRAWAEKPHLFSYPLYYISYATSALSAMDLYSEYVTDKEAATEKYEALLNVDPNLPYGEAMEKTGLKNMLSGDAVISVCDTLYRYYEQECASQIYHQLRSAYGEDVDLVLEKLGEYLPKLEEAAEKKEAVTSAGTE